MKKRIKCTVLICCVAVLLLGACREESNAHSVHPIESPETSLQIPDSDIEKKDDILVLYRGGSLSVDNIPGGSYEIKLLGSETERLGYEFQFMFERWPDMHQEFSYKIDGISHIDSIHRGIFIIDINGDGSEDIVLDLGFFGHMQKAICLVYDKETEGYVFVEGFDELASPRFSLTETREWTIVVDGSPGNLQPPYDQELEYRVEGSTLRYVGALDIKTVAKMFLF